MGVDVAVVEDVWGAPFEALAGRRSVLRDPGVWSAPDRLRAVAGEAGALVVRNRTRVTRELLRSAPGLRVVARAGAGLDNIDLDAAAELGVTVVAARGANAASVAEHTLGLALAVSRRVLELDREVRAGTWRRVPGRELAGGTWGLLSAGATARATARLARGLGMRVVAHDPYIPDDHPGIRELGIELLPWSAPSPSRTCSASISRRPRPRPASSTRTSSPAASPARSWSASDAARWWTSGLWRRRWKAATWPGAALDVRAAEPPAAGPLERMPNVVLTPHVAGITVQSQARIAQILCDDIEAVLDDRVPAHAVTPVQEGRR
ncbi:NAD(P)-dependent oxidoreductase [Actinomadura madurae]|uniref:NAD(P)-dependent oxidoreductase n=1 Tax=Actinomadura madurae TaxID=1993 RepID=UPI0020D20E63|nr:NAD(P)-dependent oxidoreductase [Actinomadura madurae]MCP9968130.1 hypothetical protein [Actinomadura madurae]MCP9980590.1 hypothetical protein [Actinomadura madurae]